MANSDNRPSPEKSQGQWDSLNCEIVEPTDVVDDYTVRPMRESLRKRLKPSFDRQPPQEPQRDGSAS
jgi:hypothetical protein